MRAAIPIRILALASAVWMAPGVSLAQRGLGPADTISVYFALDKSVVSAAAQKQLDSLRYHEVLTPDKDLFVIGYADFLGSISYNDSLSLRRARAVKDYLRSLGFKEDRIRLVTGLGEVGGRDSSVRDGYAPDRRVDIALAGPLSAMPVRRPDTVRKGSPPLAGTAPVPVAPARTIPVKQLPELAINEALLLNNLYFPHGRHFVYPASYPALDALVTTLAAHPALRVRIEGHVCCINAALVNDALDEDTGEYALSVNRAKYIASYLVEKGIARERLEYVGFGKTRPIAYPERNNADTERNRRVEIRVVSR